MKILKKVNEKRWKTFLKSKMLEKQLYLYDLTSFCACYDNNKNKIKQIKSIQNFSEKANIIKCMTTSLKNII